MAKQPKPQLTPDEKFNLMIEKRRVAWSKELDVAIEEKDLTKLYWLLVEVNSLYMIHGKPAPSGHTLIAELFLGVRELSKTAGANPVLKALRKLSEAAG
jgi:hypothetical protein